MTKDGTCDRCTGHCCEDVALYTSPEELEASYMAWLEGANRDGGAHQYDIQSFSDDPASHRLRGGFAPVYPNIHLIYPMLKFFRKDRTHPDREDQKQYKDVYHYRCVHFSDVSRQCTIYAVRPRMCRVYGLDGCGYKGCTWKDATDLRAKEAAKRKETERELRERPLPEKEVEEKK